MLLADFIKELKHKSLWINIIDQKPDEDKEVFTDTVGVLLNNVPYLNTYSKYGVNYIVPQYTYDMKPMMFIYIHEVE